MQAYGALGELNRVFLLEAERPPDVRFVAECRLAPTPPRAAIHPRSKLQGILGVRQ